QTMEDGAIVEWLKKEGDPVARGDVLYTLESDKAVLEVEAKVKGTLLKILVPAGVKVPVQTPVGIVGTPGEDISALLGEGAAEPQTTAAAPQAPAEPSAPAPTAEAVAAPAEEAGAPAQGRVFSSPRARKVAAERGVDLTQIKGSGPEGRIVEADVLAWADKQPAATPLARRMAQEMGVPLAGLAAEGARVTAEQVKAAGAPAPAAVPVAAAAAPAPMAPGKVTPLAGIRKVIAERMSASSQTTAAVTLTTEVDATELVGLRTMLKDALAKELGFNLGYNDLLAYIVARCLVEFPYVNVKLTPEGIAHQTKVNVGMAVDSDAGLLVPVIRDADKKTVKQIAIEFRQLVERARVGKAQPDDLRGGNFTITNLGMFGVDAFSPIINLPECAILGVGRIKAQPAVVDGQVAVRQMMWLSLTFDHRLVDGAPAARFLQRISQYIESPYLLLA
ncbi:MAG: 2-oxo acid dehydrogenase subunit E2, partial [Chloroflexi bacterium]|nr:2-oxo acid dehydrogenase subunit E2 [Chloroflexota bacterium]